MLIRTACGRKHIFFEAARRFFEAARRKPSQKIQSRLWMKLSFCSFGYDGIGIVLRILQYGFVVRIIGIEMRECRCAHEVVIVFSQFPQSFLTLR